jgi:hypothetical protein
VVSEVKRNIEKAGNAQYRQGNVWETMLLALVIFMVATTEISPEVYT